MLNWYGFNPFQLHLGLIVNHSQSASCHIAIVVCKQMKETRNMKKTIEESKCLASLAVFRELYNSEKDIYGIISEFVVELIVTNSKHSFNLTEITLLLNSTYDFTIPDAVVRTSLNRLNFLSKKDGIYFAENIAGLKSSNVNDKKETIQKNNDEIIEKLFLFIEKQIKRELTEIEKTTIVHSFISFIIDSTNGDEYSEYISAFIISKQNEKQFKGQLNTIKEGVVLYSGIKYNTNINEVGTWKSDLTIFIETEILFHFAGYNGEIYKKLWQDFFNYVKEINQKHPKRIKLKYFNDVKCEIERFFTKAEYIVNGDDKANPKVTAMMSIINGCETKADVVAKKVDFFYSLKSVGIVEEEFNDYFNEKYHKYNIVDQTIIDNISKELEIDDTTEYLRFLNFVSIHRKEANENNFENIGYILLSGNSKTLSIAWNKNIKAYGFVPLATTLSFLTNKFWFKLNKGFGKDNFPLTFDIITKAQIVLSNQINESVGKKFEELQEKFSKGEITEDQAKETIIELRKQARKPEEIREEEIESILNSISEESIESFLQDQEIFKDRAKNEAIENTRLKSDLSLKKKEVKAYKASQEKLNSDLILAKETLLAEKDKTIKIITNQKESIDFEIKKSIFNFKFIVGLLLLLAFVATHFVIVYLGWNNSEKWTWIFYYSIPLFFSLIYMLTTERTINPIDLIKRKRKKISERMYKKFNFNSQLLEELKGERKILTKDIEKLVSQHTTRNIKNWAESAKYEHFNIKQTVW